MTAKELDADSVVANERMIARHDICCESDPKGVCETAYRGLTTGIESSS